MENSSIDGSLEPVNTESKIPLILAIAAFVLGGLSFVFAWSTKSALNRHADSIRKDVAAAVDASKQAAADARNVGTGSSAVETLRTDFDELKASVRSEYNRIARSQEMVIQRMQQLNERVAALSGNRGTTVATPANSGSSTSSANVATPASGKYKVQKGDNPSTIAKKLGVKVNDLLDANPGLDPRRLRIGQELNVPQK